jgi:hypothetical protein
VKYFQFECSKHRKRLVEVAEMFPFKRPVREKVFFLGKTNTRSVLEGGLVYRGASWKPNIFVRDLLYICPYVSHSSYANARLIFFSAG